MPSGPTILLIDDDADHRQFFRESMILLEIEHELFISKNCADLTHLIQKEISFDVIIIDVNIQGEDGKDCLKKLKENERSKKIPVIIFTISQDIEDIEEAFESGAHHYAIKPYSKINYKATLSKIFANDWTTPPPTPSKENFVIDLTFH